MVSPRSQSQLWGTANRHPSSPPFPTAVWVTFPLLECWPGCAQSLGLGHTWLHFRGCLALSPASLTWQFWFLGSRFLILAPLCTGYVTLPMLLNFSELVSTYEKER